MRCVADMRRAMSCTFRRSKLTSVPWQHPISTSTLLFVMRQSVERQTSGDRTPSGQAVPSNITWGW